jgi:hypothetical protein
MATFFSIPYCQMSSEIAITSASGVIFTASSAHGLSYGSLVKVVVSSGIFTMNSLWLVLGSNLNSVTFSLSYKSDNFIPGADSPVAAVNSVAFVQVPLSFSPRVPSFLPNLSLDSIFEVHPDPFHMIGIGVRWSGFVRVPTLSPITFSFSLAGTSSSSIVREKLNFYVNGNVLINSWYSIGGLNTVATFSGVPGTLYSIEIEYGSSFPSVIRCILYWKWDALSYLLISPLHLFAASQSSSELFLNVIPSFVLPQKCVIDGFKQIATSGIASVFRISTFDRFQNPSGLSSISDVSSM